MIEITNEMALGLSSTNRLLCQEMLRRDWKVRTPYLGLSHFYIDRGDGRTIHIYSSSPSTLSFAAAHVSNDKYATAEVLSANGVYQLPMHLLSNEEVTEGARHFVAENAPVIVKPLDGAHGDGITADVASDDLLQYAVRRASQESRTGRVLLQRQLTAVDLKDLRILVINKQFIGAIHRVPARVFGDGQATAKELIIRENQQPNRGEQYRNELAIIDVESAGTFLGDAINHVPATGEEVTVRGVANYGAGGELVDVTDFIPEWMKKESVRIADVLELPVAGIDYMVGGEIVAAVNSGENAAVVIEVNKAPSLCIHDEPTVGEDRGATQVYVDYLASL